MMASESVDYLRQQTILIENYAIDNVDDPALLKQLGEVVDSCRILADNHENKIISNDEITPINRKRAEQLIIKTNQDLEILRKMFGIELEDVE